MGSGCFFNAIKEFLFGFAVHDHVVFAAKTRAGLGDLLTVVMFGDMLGLPIVRPYYGLRLLPHMLPRLRGWKRRMLMERDLLDALD
jgi:hypothetical protein